MNILWISHIIPYPPKTGVLQRSYNLLKETSKLGNVYLLALHKKKVLPVQYDLQDVKRELGKMCRHVEIMDIPVESSRIKRYGLFFKSIFNAESLSVSYYRTDEMHRRIQALVSNVKFDVAHFDTISLAEYADDIGNIKKILNHHNIESDLLQNRSLLEKNILKKMYYRQEAKKLKQYHQNHCDKFDVNFTVSELDKELLLNEVPNIKIEVIPNGVDTDYFYQSSADTVKRSLIIVSGMNWYPNRDAVHYMIKEIWPLLIKEIPDLKLTVVGAQPTEILVDLAKKDNRITVTGFVDDVRPYLESAEIYLCPMRDGGGTRLKILDALSMGKTIISTRKGCEGIDVTPGKNVLIADTPAQFLSQIRKVIENPELGKMLSIEGRKLVTEKYSWEIIGKKLSNIYKAFE